MAALHALSRLGRGGATLLSRPLCLGAARCFAAQGAAAGEEDVVVSVFKEEQQKFRQFFDQAKGLHIPLKGDPKAVEEFHNKVGQIKDKLKMPSNAERLQQLMEFNMVTADYDVKAFLALMSHSMPGDVVADCVTLVDNIEEETGEILRFGDNPNFRNFISQMQGVLEAYGVADADPKQLELDAEKELIDGLRAEAQEEMETVKESHDLKFLNVDAGNLKATVGGSG